MFVATTATNKLLKLRQRIRCVSGGTSASKTISILLILIDYCQTFNSELVSVVSESFPHLKRGCIRDFLNIMTEHKYYRDERWNKTDFTYTFETGTKLEFFSADQPGKVRGPRRDVLFINEANNISYETYTQLEVRTKKIIWLDWNPVQEFWYYTRIQHDQPHDFLTLTYKDNESLDPRIVESIEARRNNKMWWQVYGMGQLGEVEGRIYRDWAIVDDVPHEARLERFGLDFGFSNDPAAIVAAYKYNGGYILDEISYITHQSNKQLADIFTNLPPCLIVADSAEPKSISEIAGYGISIMPASKGKDSLLHGIQYVQQQRISVTKNSTNLLKEYRNYMWMTKKNSDADQKDNVPAPGLDHALDAVRYAIVSTVPDLEVEVAVPDWAESIPEWAGMDRSYHG
jgi:phage terminase large subunit